MEHLKEMISTEKGTGQYPGNPSSSTGPSRRKVKLRQEIVRLGKANPKLWERLISHVGGRRDGREG